MKTNRLHKHLALAAVATAAVVTTSNASVVYSGVINFVCAVDIDGCYVNVETGLLSNGPGSGVPGWDVNPYSTSGGMNFFNSTGGGQMRRPAVTTGTAGNLALNTPVVSTGSYNTGTGNVYGTTSATGLLGGWTYSSENIIGFKFVAAAGTTHYGWMRFAMGAAGSSGTSMTRTIVDYEWETTPGLPIDAGSVGGPPPDYDPCATFNPTASVGINNLPMNSTTAANLLTSCGTAYKANYFKFTAPFAGAFGFNACATNGVKLALLSGCSAGSSVLSCGSPCQVSEINLTAGQIVYCVVGGDTAATELPNPLPVTVTPPPTPDCAAAPAVAFGSSPFNNVAFTGNQTVATNATGTLTTIIYNTAWSKFTPTVTGAYTFSLCGSVNDTKMAHSAVCPGAGTMASIAYNDDNCACSSGCSNLLWSSSLNLTNTGLPLTQDLVAGQTYHLVVGSFSATSGAVSGSMVIDGPPQGLPCPGDYNGDGFRDGADLAALLSAWGTAGGDINGDGATDGADLSTLLSGWGTCPQ